MSKLSNVSSLISKPYSINKKNKYIFTIFNFFVFIILFLLLYSYIALHIEKHRQLKFLCFELVAVWSILFPIANDKVVHDMLLYN